MRAPATRWFESRVRMSGLRLAYAPQPADEPGVDQDELNDLAKRLVQDNARHSTESLFQALCRYASEATDEQIDAAIEAAL